MQIRYNEILKTANIGLLLYSLSDLSYQTYEFIRFTLMASFAWLAIGSIDKYQKEWKYLFFIFAILFNPFLKIKFGKDIWHNIDVSISFILIINLYQNNFADGSLLNKIKRLFSSKIFWRICKIFIALTVSFFLVNLLIQQYKRKQEHIAFLEKKQRADSLKRIQYSKDSLQAIAQKVITRQKDSIKLINKELLCTKESALQNFNDYMAFYYPSWKIMNKPKTRQTSDCVFEISTLVKERTTYMEYTNSEALVCEIEFSELDLYKKYFFRAVTAPVGFER